MNKIPENNLVTLRKLAGATTADDLTISLQPKTFEYLKTSSAKEIQVSAYFDRDWTRVEETYAELFVDEGFAFRIVQIIPGSRSRKAVLPGPMNKGEQLVIRVIKKG